MTIASTFSLFPESGFALVLLASTYGTGRWVADATWQLAAFLERWPRLAELILGDSELDSDIPRDDWQILCGAFAGGAYFLFWLVGYLSTR